MIRVEGWEERLAAEIAAAKSRRWAWGVHDCCAFAQCCVSALLDGPTPWDDWFRYDNFDTAAARLREGGGLNALLDLHAERIPVMFARRGDLATLPSEDGPAGLTLGVVEGAHVWAAAHYGLDRAPVTKTVAAWLVG